MHPPALASIAKPGENSAAFAAGGGAPKVDG